MFIDCIVDVGSSCQRRVVAEQACAKRDDVDIGPSWFWVAGGRGGMSGGRDEMLRDDDVTTQNTDAVASTGLLVPGYDWTGSRGK